MLLTHVTTINLIFFLKTTKTINKCQRLYLHGSPVDILISVFVIPPIQRKIWSLVQRQNNPTLKKKKKPGQAAPKTPVALDLNCDIVSNTALLNP